MADVKITADSSNLIEGLKNINNRLSETEKATEKVTEKSKEQSSVTQAGLNGMIEKMTKFITIQKSGETFDAMKGLQAQFSAITGSITSGLSVLTAFKDEIMKFEKIETEKTALRLMSKEGEDLNKVLSRTRDITLGVAKGSEILETVNKLLVKGFNLTEQSLEKLIDVSGIYSSVTGDDMNSIMMQLATASQRERDIIFEKMGVYINHTEVINAYAKKMGITADKIDEATKSNILMSEAVGQLKTHFDSLGLSAVSLESKTTHAFKKAEDSYNSFKKAVLESGLNVFNEAIDRVESFMMIINKDWNAYDSKKAEKVVEDYKNQWSQIVLAKEQATLTLTNSNLRTDGINEEQNKINVEKNKKSMEQFAQTMESLEAQKNVLHEKITIARQTMNTREMNELGVTVSNSWISFKNIWDDVIKKSTDYANQKNNETKKTLWNAFELKAHMDSLDRQATKDVKKAETVNKNDTKLDTQKEARDNEKHEKLLFRDWEISLESDLELALDEFNDRKLLKTIKNKQLLFEVEQDKIDNETKIADKIEEWKNDKKDREIQFEIDIYNEKAQIYKDYTDQHITDLNLNSNQIEKMTRKELKTLLSDEQFYQNKKLEVQKEFLTASANFTSTSLNEILLGSQEFNKKFVGDFVKGIGTQMISSGAMKFFEGLGGIIFPTPALTKVEASALIKVGTAQMGAGLVMGGVGNIVSGMGSAKKDSKVSETDKSKQKSNNNEMSVTTYLFPNSKAYYRQQIDTNRRISR